MGRVKTRLARDVGAVAATRFYRSTARAVIARLATCPRWTTELAVAPATAVFSRALSCSPARFAQSAGGLGERMQAIMDRPGAIRTVIVGTDIPAIRPSHIARAFARLGSNRAVLGPAGDGGYWLVGLNRIPRAPRPFADVRWSSEHALVDTLRNLAGKSVAIVDTLHDVDDAAGLATSSSWCGRLVLPHSARCHAPN